MGGFIWYSLLAVGVGTLIAVGVLWFLLLLNGHTVRRLQEQNKALAARLALIEAPAADAWLHDRRPQLPDASPKAVATARLPTDEAIFASPFGDQPL
jgi:hypothetical protein